MSVEIGELSQAFIDGHPADAARVLEHQPPEACAELFAQVPARTLAPAVRAMLPFMAAQALIRLPAATAAHVLTECGAGAAAAIMRYVPESRRIGLMEALPTPAAVSLRLLLGFPANTVGAWIDTDLPALPGGTTAGAALERLRTGAQEEVELVHVVDPRQKLLGLVELSTLLRAGQNVTLAHLMHEPQHVLPVTASLESVRHHPGWDEYMVLPAVERDGRLTGVLRRASLLQALAHVHGDTRKPGSEQTNTGITLGGAYFAAVDGLLRSIIAFLPGGRPVKQQIHG